MALFCFGSMDEYLWITVGFRQTQQQNGGSPLLFHWCVFLGLVEAQSVMCMYSGHFFGINVIGYIIANLFSLFFCGISYFTFPIVDLLKISS